MRIVVHADRLTRRLFLEGGLVRLVGTTALAVVATGCAPRHAGVPASRSTAAASVNARSPASPTSAGAAATSGATTPRVAGPPRSAGTVSVMVMHFYGVSGLKNIHARLQAAQRALPDVKIHAVEAPGSTAYREKLFTMMAAGGPPDVFLTSQAPGSGYAFGIMAARKQMLDLDPYVKRDQYDVNDYFPVMISYDTYQGRLYALPNDINCYGLFCNIGLFQKAGQKLPPQEWNAPGWTWDDLRATALALSWRNGQGRATEFGFAVLNSVEWLSAWIWSSGGHLLNQNQTATEIDQPPAVATLQFLADLVNKDKVAPSPTLTATESPVQIYETERMGMYQSGSFSVNVFRNDIKGRFPWDVAVLPRGKAGRISVAGGASWAVASQSKHPDQAWKVVGQLSGKASQTIGATFGQMPSRRSVATSAAYLKASKIPPHIDVFIQSAEHARHDPLLTNWGLINDTIQSELDYLWEGQKDARAVTAEIKRKIDPMIEQGLAAG